MGSAPLRGLRASATIATVGLASADLKPSTTDAPASPARSIDDLPGPPGLPLLGNALQLRRADRFHLLLEEWCRRYGPIFRVKIGPGQQVIGIGDEQAINEILRDRPEGFRRSRVFRETQEEILGESEHLKGGYQPGVFAAEGEDWKRQRRLVVTALNSNHLHRYFHIVRTATERLHRRLARAAADSRPLEISDDLTSFTVDVTSALAFGHDLNTLERGDDELRSHIQRLFAMTARRLTTPIPYWRLFKLPADRALDRSVDELLLAVEGFIERAKARLESEPERYEEPENLLEGMLAAQRAEGTFTDQEIVGNVLTLLFAGEDTTAHTLGWTIWLLASHPEVQPPLAAEAIDVLDGEPIPTSYESTERLAYADAVLRESMRLKSVAPISGVEPTEDRTICDTHIPAGSRLVLMQRHAGRGPTGREAEFYPERWLEDSDETRAPKSLAFGAGPRFCPGRNLAVLEAKAALAMIARNFEIELDGPAAPVESFGFTMAPHGLRVRLRARQDAR
jgi:cytochrome P450